MKSGKRYLTGIFRLRNDLNKRNINMKSMIIKIISGGKINEKRNKNPQKINSLR